ncbi:MAG TPA: sigma-70 family RNA polymerase sigma factor [Blastocatellia bacterium]|nr:sigma-70 family RNA polymerase sigma factor [Blastocatellia bacterium]
MPAEPLDGITRLLAQWSNGDHAALDELMPLVYDELRRVAIGHLRRERGNFTLQPTALVHEVYLRLTSQQNVDSRSRAQFFSLAATMMRNILVDYARRAKAAKRGGPQYTLSLSQADHLGSGPDVALMALDDALTELAAIKPQHSKIVELRFFGGLTIEETAEVLEVSHATVERGWTFARAWLRNALEPSPGSIDHNERH